MMSQTRAEIFSFWHQLKTAHCCVRLSDSSPAFDPLNRPDPDDLDAPLAERAIGGLGVFLATQNVDEFLYEYSNEQNHNIFVVNLQKAEESS